MSGFLKKLTACGAILCALSPLFAVRRAKAEILMTPPSVCRGQVNDPVLGWLRVTLYDDGSGTLVQETGKKGEGVVFSRNRGGDLQITKDGRILYVPPEGRGPVKEAVGRAFDRAHEKCAKIPACSRR